MARVRLANWWGGHAPGEVVEVGDGEVAGLRRDGRIAEVLPVGEPAPAIAVSSPPEPPAEQIVSIEGGAEEPRPKPRRRSKSDE